MFLLQAAAFLLLSQVHHFGLLSLLAFLILLCHGGGFGTMPAFATDYFGAGQIGSIYGLMLTAWGCAAVFGPSLVAGIRQARGHYQGAMRWLRWRRAYSPPRLATKGGNHKRRVTALL